MKKRVFISFAIEDESSRNIFVGQSRNKNIPFEFIDMSVKEPWSEDWKNKCLTKIKGCNGMIVLVGNETSSSKGVEFEIKCAKDERMPLLGIYTKPNNNFCVPEGLICKNWTWDNIKNFIDGL